MTDFNEIWELERKCWVEGRSFYQEIITEHSAYAFPPPMGIFMGKDFVAQMGESGPCIEVEFQNQIARDLGNTVAVIYLGIGKTADGGLRKSHCSTVWENIAGSWKLVLHHQTPLSE